MAGEESFEAKVDKVTSNLERRYTEIDASNEVIRKNRLRAGAVCGPRTQAQYAIASAQNRLGSAEDMIEFYEQIAASPAEWGEQSDVAKAALAEVAKRRSA